MLLLRSRAGDRGSLTRSLRRNLPFLCLVAAAAAFRPTLLPPHFTSHWEQQRLLVADSSRLTTAAAPSEIALNAVKDSEQSKENVASSSKRAVGGANGDVFSGGLVSLSSSDAKSQLFSAFVALDLPDQYDAVLTGLCAKILDSKDMKEEQVAPALQDPLQLFNEMNQKRIQASPRSLMALIDSTVKAQDAKAMARVLSLARKNGGIRQYGEGQADIMPLPTNPRSRVKCPDGTFKTREERLANVADIPTDERGIEVRNALVVVAVATACALTDVTSMDDVTPYSNLLLGLLLSVGAVDNFYDILRLGTNFVASQLNKNNDNKKGSDSKAFKLPEKDSLPFGLGTGQISGSVVRGVTRLITVDVERECQCEAAALFAAYTLGLPCFAFQPNALEGSVLVVDSTNKSNELDSLDSSSGILRMLIWLLAPVAMESSKHSQLIMSDPREAEGFLTRLEEYSRNRGNVLDSIWWTQDVDDGTSERAALLKWAYTEADLLLRENRAMVTELSQCLTGGAATIGDCVAVMEQW